MTTELQRISDEDLAILRSLEVIEIEWHNFVMRLVLSDNVTVAEARQAIKVLQRLLPPPRPTATDPKLVLSDEANLIEVTLGGMDGFKDEAVRQQLTDILRPQYVGSADASVSLLLEGSTSASLQVCLNVTNGIIPRSYGELLLTDPTVATPLSQLVQAMAAQLGVRVGDQIQHVVIPESLSADASPAA